METLDYDHNIFNEQAARQADASLAVRFFIMAIQNEAKSHEAGRPIFEDTEMIEIRIRGDRNNVVQRPVRDDDKRRFRDAYRAYQDGKTELAEGTPLSEWPLASKSMVEELKYLGFTTVEHVAAANDNACANVPGLTSLKQRAAAFLQLAKGVSPVEKIQTELEQERAAKEALQAQVADLAKRLASLEAKGVVQEGTPLPEAAQPKQTVATAKAK